MMMIHLLRVILSFVRSLKLNLFNIKNIHPVWKKESTVSLHNFNKFRHSLVIFDMNHSDNQFY